jgi:hypothetical protein
MYYEEGLFEGRPAYRYGPNERWQFYSIDELWRRYRHANESYHRLYAQFMERQEREE